MVNEWFALEVAKVFGLCPGQPQVVILVGAPGSGKSTLASEIAANCGHQLIAVEAAVVRANARFRGIQSRAAFEAELALGYEEYFRTIDAGLAQGLNLVLDEQHAGRRQRQDLAARISSKGRGHLVFFVSMNTPSELCHQRNVDRSRMTGLIVNEKDIQDFFAELIKPENQPSQTDGQWLFVRPAPTLPQGRELMAWPAGSEYAAWHAAFDAAMKSSGNASR